MQLYLIPQRGKNRHCRDQPYVVLIYRKKRTANLMLYNFSLSDPSVSPINAVTASVSAILLPTSPPISKEISDHVLQQGKKRCQSRLDFAFDETKQISPRSFVSFAFFLSFYLSFFLSIGKNKLYITTVEYSSHITSRLSFKRNFFVFFSISIIHSFEFHRLMGSQRMDPSIVKSVERSRR